MRNVIKAARGKRGGSFSFSESDGLQAGDSIGNRQKFSETRIHADDIGNRLSSMENQAPVRDDIGNSVGMGPTHLESGILVAIEGKNRRRREPKSLDSRNSNVVGGVNPLVSGNQALLSMFLSENGEDHDESELLPKASVIPREPSQKKVALEVKRSSRGTDRSVDSSDRWLKRLLELEDEDRLEPATNADPKRKALEARAALSEIMVKGGVMAAIGTQVGADPESGRPNVLVSFEDMDIEDDSSQLANLFSSGSLSLLALNFLMNKIVNKVQDERVRIQVGIRKSHKA